MNKDQVEKTLRSFLEFKEDWDSYQAKPFSKELIKNCIEFVSVLDEDLAEPHVAPFNGGVLFEWSGERDLELTIEEEDDFLDYMLVYPNGSISESRTYKKDWKNLNKLIKYCKGRENGGKSD